MNPRRLLAPLSIAVALATVATAGPASASPSVPARPQAPAVPPPATDPGLTGPETVDVLEYDLGDEAFQPDGFTAPVELRGRVYAPQTIAGRAPIVVVMHGRHVTCGSTEENLRMEWPCPDGIPEIPSYRGYDAIGQNLASHGVVTVSIGANGINANDGYFDDGGASARAQLVMETLRRLRSWDQTDVGSPFGTRFVGHLDLGNVGLMGHSRGGEGVVAGADLNQRTGSPFGIRAVLALAPVDFGRRVLGTVPLGVVLPYCDGDVSDLQGVNLYDDARYALAGDPAARSTFLLYGANHNWFNTAWTTGPGSFDDADYLGFEGNSAGDPTVQSCVADAPGRLDATQQVAAGTALVAGYLRRYLLDDEGLQRLVTGTAPFPASALPARWAVSHHAPDRLDVQRWDTPTNTRRNRFGQVVPQTAGMPAIVCNDAAGYAFDSPTGSAAGTDCPNLGPIAVTNDTGVMDLGWSRPTAVLRQPLGAAGVDVSGFDGIRFRVAVPDEDRNMAVAGQDLSVVIEDTSGARASVPVAPLTNALARVNPGYPRHSVLNGVRVPLTMFAGVDLSRIRAVELRADRTPNGRLHLADLAFTDEGTDDAVGPTDGAVPVAAPTPACRAGAGARWGCAVAHVLIGRDLSPAEIARAVSAYPTAEGRRRFIAGMVAGPTAGMRHQTRFAQTYSQADIDSETISMMLSAKGRSHWEVGVRDLAGALTYGGPNLAGTTQIIDALYETLTGHRADAAGRAYWANRIQFGDVGPLVAALQATQSHRAMVVDIRYRQILSRSADAGGRAYWIARLGQPGSEQAMVATMLGTQSFLAAASA